MRFSIPLLALNFSCFIITEDAIIKSSEDNQGTQKMLSAKSGISKHNLILFVRQSFY